MTFPRFAEAPLVSLSLVLAPFAAGAGTRRRQHHRAQRGPRILAIPLGQLVGVGVMTGRCESPRTGAARSGRRAAGPSSVPGAGALVTPQRTAVPLRLARANRLPRGTS